MHRLYVFLIILASVLIFDYHARGAFIAAGYCRRYGHGKTWKRAHRHYKTNWSFWERMFWIPVFKEPYEQDFRIMAYFSYIHSIWAVITYICFIVSDLYFPDSKFWIYEFIAFWVFVLIRFVFSDYMGKYDPKKRK